MRLPAARLDTLARGLALAAAALMILSAVRFRSDPLVELNQTPDYDSAYAFPPGRPRYPVPAPTSEAVRWLIGGGVLLMGSLALSRRLPAPPVASDLPLRPARPRWLPLIGGIGALWMLADANATQIGWDRLDGLSPDGQAALLGIGTVLVGMGLAGKNRAQQAAPLPRTATLEAPQSIMHEVAPLLILTLLALGLRVWNLGESIHAFVDELNFATAAREFEWMLNNRLLQPITTVVAFPRLYPYGQHFFFDLWGHNLTGLRLLSALIGALTVPALYLLARALFDRPTALVAAALLATFPAHLHYSRLGMNNIADPLFGTLALALLGWAMRTQRRTGYALAGLCLGLTQYFYEAGRIVFPVLMIGWLCGGLLIWRRRPSLRGLLITLLAALIVALPIYITLLGSDQPLAARSQAMIYPDDHWRGLVNAAPHSAAWDAHLDHLKETFLIYVQRHEASFYYAGETPFVLIFWVPALLLGAVTALWRIRTPGGLLPLLWITTTSLGNSFMVAHQDSPRYVTVFPALALLCALGLRTVWGISIQPSADNHPTGAANAAPTRLRSAHVILAALVIVLCAGQTWYYFGPHLDLFNYQYRRAKLDPDCEDALFRAQHFAPGTQIYLISDVACNERYANDLIAFLGRDLTVVALSPQQLSMDTMWGLPRTVDYAFFIAPDDQDTLGLLKLYFRLNPPAYTPYDIAPDKQLVLYYAPSTLPGHRRSEFAVNR
jgi:4-amino-4-deoxy-L-arabinose transferase-like glycosyltransferase